MDQIGALIDYLRSNPRAAVGIGIGIVALYLFLQRKSRLEKEADKRLSALHQEKAGRYNSLRPPE